ncbi:MAG TPA: dihydrofolate reductase family protein [Pyrinomonadaceae bacterium]|nr:dihydrofolate reductase family protein [Pyrinomonadaceae bacterium]
MEKTIADKYKEYVQRETEVASRKVLPMRTIAELETREFPEVLPHRIRAIYDGHFYAPLPSTPDRPYGTVVFASTLNGKVTFAEPKDIQATFTDYYFYRELSKVFTDAVIAGAETVRGSPDQERFTMSIYDPELIAFRTRVLQKSRHPLHVVITGSGNIAVEKEYIFNLPEFKVLVFTTARGQAVLSAHRFDKENVRIVSMGERIDFRTIPEILQNEYAVERMLLIGGASVATQFIDAGVIDEMFITSANTLGHGNARTFYEGKQTLEMRTVSLKLLEQEPDKRDSIGPILRRVRFL